MSLLLVWHDSLLEAAFSVVAGKQTLFLSHSYIEKCWNIADNISYHFSGYQDFTHSLLLLSVAPFFTLINLAFQRICVLQLVSLLPDYFFEGI
jgi:hypothetical protein